MTYGTKTQLWFAGAGVAMLLAIYCFAGAVMNGSFAIADAVYVDKRERNAAVFFWISITFALLAVGCFAWGIVRYRRQRGRGQTSDASSVWQR